MKANKLRKRQETRNLLFTQYLFILIEKGTIFGFGHNMCGQLGDKSTEDARLPKMAAMPPGSRVTRISCGYYHSICLTGKPILFLLCLFEDRC